MPEYSADQGFLQETVAKELVKQNLNANNEVTSAVSEIISRAPTNLTLRTMNAWCARYVETALARHPELRTEGENFRFAVKREILARIYESLFAELKNWAQENPNEKISPNVIFKKFPKAWDRFKDNFRSADGKDIDWKFIANRLELGERFAYQAQAERTEKMAVAELLDLLEAELPKKFSPNWIHDQNEDLWRHIVKNYRNSDQEPDWDRIIVQLPDEWRKRWTKGRHTLKEMERRATPELLIELNDKKPDYFGPSWIYRNEKIRWIYFFYLRHKRDPETGSVKWDALVKPLQEEWRNKWTYQEHINKSGNHKNSNGK